MCIQSNHVIRISIHSVYVDSEYTSYIIATTDKWGPEVCVCSSIFVSDSWCVISWEYKTGLEDQGHCL